MSRFVKLPGTPRKYDGGWEVPFRVFAKDQILTYWWGKEDPDTLYIMPVNYGTIKIQTDADCTRSEIEAFIEELNK
jgi:hypothetical protein